MIIWVRNKPSDCIQTIERHGYSNQSGPRRLHLTRSVFSEEFPRYHVDIRNGKYRGQNCTGIYTHMDIGDSENHGGVDSGLFIDGESERLLKAFNGNGLDVIGVYTIKRGVLGKGPKKSETPRRARMKVRYRAREAAVYEYDF